MHNISDQEKMLESLRKIRSPIYPTCGETAVQFLLGPALHTEFIVRNRFDAIFPEGMAFRHQQEVFLEIELGHAAESQLAVGRVDSFLEGRLSGFSARR